MLEVAVRGLIRASCCSRAPTHGASNGTVEVITRRLLLGHGVSVSFLLPACGRRGGGRRACRGAASRRAAAGPRATLPLVMLDPGHGGKDPGAIGVSGTYEKHVALAAAQELKRQLEAAGRYRVELTRARDVFIPLEDRVGSPQQHGARPVRLDARRRDDRPRRARRQRLHPGRAPPRTRRPPPWRSARTPPTGSPGPASATPPEVAHILASLVRQETRAGSARMARGLVGELDQRPAAAAEPGAACRFRGAEGGRHPKRAGGNGLHVQPRRTRRRCARPEHRARGGERDEPRRRCLFRRTGRLALADADRG